MRRKLQWTWMERKCLMWKWPRVPLEACLATFSGEDEIPDFYSTALNSKTTAIKTAGLKTFPDYLVLQMRKFVMEAGWVPKKLDVYIDVLDIIDISHMGSKGVQPGEELLPEGASSGTQVEPARPVANEDIVSQLASMGFNFIRCHKAAINTSNTGVEEAMNWLLSHMDDPDIDVRYLKIQCLLKTLLMKQVFKLFFPLDSRKMLPEWP